MNSKDAQAVRSSLSSEIGKINKVIERLTEDITKAESTSADAQPGLIQESRPVAEDIRDAQVLLRSARRSLVDAMLKSSN